MGEKTGIAWTDSTWNPVRGCTKVSAGCKHCYAETFAERFRGVPGHPFEQGFDLRLVPEALELPLHWKKPRRIFVNSMSDLFHEGVPDSFVELVFAVMALAPQHTFQVLTKRPARMRAFLGAARPDLYSRLNVAARRVTGLESIAILPTQRHGMVEDRWPLPNVWLGVSVEDQRAADERIPELLATPAAVRFLSCEPLLGLVDLRGSCRPWGPTGASAQLLSRIHWVIVGGESGPGARQCEVPWIRAVVKQCAHAGVPTFVKQLGANIIDRNDAGFDGDEPWTWPEHLAQEDRIEHLEEGYQGAPVRVHTRDRAGRDPAEWPANLRVQHIPVFGRIPEAR